MGACSKCNGTGVCHNGIHSTHGFLDEALNAVTGGMYTCEDCGQAANTPGDCPNCNGTGEWKDDE